MPVFEKDGERCLFIHIPKTGGTTIEDVLVRNGHQMSFRRGGPYGALTDGDHENGCSPQHMHAELLQKVFSATEFDHVFTVVRHPTARLVSEFKFRRFIDEKRGAGMGISDWLEQVEERYSMEPMVFDNHIRPQSEFIWSSDCEVFRMEDGHPRIFAALGQHMGPIAYHGEHLTGLPDPNQAELLRIAEPFARDFYAEDFRLFGY